MSRNPSEPVTRAWIGLMRARETVLGAIERDLKAADCLPLAWYDVLLELVRAPQGRLRPHHVLHLGSHGRGDYGSGALDSRMRILRWGILGTARINRALVPPLASSPRNTLHAIASRDLARAEESIVRSHVDNCLMFGYITDFHFGPALPEASLRVSRMTNISVGATCFQVDAWPNAVTVASGLRVPSPFADTLILDAIHRSGGTAVAVSEESMLDAMLELARLEGCFACPEGGATLAALRQLVTSGELARDARVVIYNTGSGLKYPEAWRAALARRARPGAEQVNA